MAVKKVVKKRKELKNVDKGQVHIKSSFNNTIALPIRTETTSLIAVRALSDLKVREKALRLRLSRLRKRLLRLQWNTDFVLSKFM